MSSTPAGRTAPAGFTVQGKGRPIVLLHSSLAHKGQWRALAQDLSCSHRVIAIDLYGYGDTVFPQRTADFGLMDEVRLVGDVLAEVLRPGERFHLVGHSYGGAVALRLAYAMQPRVRSLAVFEPTAFHLLEHTEPGHTDIVAIARAVELGIASGKVLDATGHFVDYWTGPDSFVRLPAEKQAALAQRICKVPLDFRALIDEPIARRHYGVLALPVCLVSGMFSPRTSQSVIARLAEVLPDRQLHWVTGGHMAPITQPDKVNPIISGFIHQVDLLGVSFGPESAWQADPAAEADIARFVA